MRTRCPCCGSTLSLDALVAHESAREALQTAFKLSMPLGSGLVRYLALFRPKSQELTFARVARLLNELLPAIQAQRIQRDGQVYEAPPEAWLYAIEQALIARDDGRLKTPLKKHDWLYTVISNWKPTVEMVVRTEALKVRQVPASKTLSGIAALEGLKNG